MGCTVSLVCCEALEPLPSCGPQPPGTPPGPARPERGEPGGAAPVQRRRLLLQVGSCGQGAGSGHDRARLSWDSKESGKVLVGEWEGPAASSVEVTPGPLVSLKGKYL